MSIVVESRKFRLPAISKVEASLAAFAATDKISRLTVFPSGGAA
jgi:hypothetical protein